jgi:hypothetical protein
VEGRAHLAQVDEVLGNVAVEVVPATRPPSETLVLRPRRLGAMLRQFPNDTVAAAASAGPSAGDFFAWCRMTTKNGLVPSGRGRLTT